ncbi:hypothetical protein CERSUDRAFT_110472 [Gelatoporia subvermispora B]|uniref:Alcohol acetyltransferase n=1 Tax=Ceriporiopsis subvermispora (strain B) TaxID=914234 RepID=M2RU08_CERS8|nr:hypothetical protein CERSUDRAFT_110472 [Gelatoporia subvermispora B]
MSLQSGLPTPPAHEGELCELGSDVNFKTAHNACRSEGQYGLRYERKMGNTELSYYLPSRQTGVNDMYLHLGFKAPERYVQRSRVRAVWAILRLRHPLLSAHVEMHEYDDVRFIYTAPSSPRDLFEDADNNLEYRTQDKDELIDSYLNGPRTLSNSRLSYVVVSEPGEAKSAVPTPPRTPSPSRSSVDAGLIHESETPTEIEREYELLICAMHFLGDGMALHQFANDFFGLLGCDMDDADLEAMLEAEWRDRWQNISTDASVLPRSLEEYMPLSDGRFRRTAAKVDFQLSQERLVGGQVFPRQKHPERRTIVPTVSFPEDRTKAILKKCKANGVSISAALFAICDVAWARMGGPKELPVLMYSALNLRPYFTVKPPSPWNSYWYLAIGYFNIVLPSFLPAADKVESVFWHRARQAKDQSTRAAKSPLVASRTHVMAEERGERARGWAKEDDEKEQGTWKPPVYSSSASPPKEPILPARPKAPSAALMGLSLLGNLDGIYKHATFPSVRLHTLTTGSRQRHGAMLLFGYTFQGKLWISLGYDCNGYPDGFVDKFWKECLAAVDVFLG